ncbi:hypothetical protein Tco_1016418 [Tanacetum coccineum]|uniref:Uncharacterized protein n=1 Tax=Tanacetum coccineum TaxID=301880 RepID=A0ABQ5FPW9_9ASTR
MVSAAKDPLTFDDLMATPIDFSKYVLYRLQIDNLTQEILVGPAYNLLKGTCASSIKLEYNMEECFKALTDRLHWNNPEGDLCPFDLTKPLPLKGRPCHLSVAAEYFFNNDLEFLKSFDREKKYTTSITKTKKILGVKSVSVKKLHGYGHLEEIVVKRADRQLYKFKEESYQKKLNITEPQNTFPEIEFKELYTPSHKPLGMSRRKWTATNKKRLELKVKLIDKQMQERMIIRNLERLVGAWELEMDYKLITHIV